MAPNESDKIIHAEDCESATSLIPDLEHNSWLETYRFALRILNVLSLGPGDQETFREILFEIIEFTGISALGIRLKNGEDYPYYVSTGFSEDFLASENSLWCLDTNGEVVRDAYGTPPLRCACGNLIRMLNNLTEPFLTEFGSFRVNDVKELLCAFYGTDTGNRARNSCAAEGFESVLLVPLKSQTQTIGLLQANDDRKNRFTSELTALIELIATGFGMALSRSAAEETLSRASEKFTSELAKRTSELTDFNQQLKQEIGERQVIEEQLILVQDGLERRIDHRTAELRASNETLLLEIDEHKRTTEALRISEIRFREIYENAPVMMHSINPDGIILNVNEKWLTELGYSREEAIGRRMDFIMTPESARRAFGEVLPAYWKEGKISDVSYQYVTKDKRVMDVLLDSHVIQDPVWGAISLSVIRDVTDHKNAEEELLRSEQRFRAVFESARDCMYIKNQTLRYTHANPAMEKVLGIKAEYLLGITDEELYGEDAGKHLREVDLRVLAGQPVEEEHSRPIRGVQFVFHDIKVPLRDSEGEIVGLCGVSRNVTERKKIQPESSMIAREYPSPSMQAALSKARYAAATDIMILLLGESGSGKDYLARVIHANSKRANGPFFGINCAAIPPELAESELFGHEAGAFTGARGRKRGLLELAEGGTLLLNEIGELPLYLQSKLLTFLDTKTILRVGGEKQIHVNARLIAATHRNLGAEIEAGRFLKALYYRLNVFTIEVPPLRERREDISILLEEIMAQLAAEMQLNEIPPVDSTSLIALNNYSWPGNVRELRNVLERALIISDSSGLNFGLPGGDYRSQDWFYKLSFPEDRTLQEITDEMTKLLCVEALRRSRGNKKLAAQFLGISRFSLYRHLKGRE
jgi:PAS domain S-box-containing protein